MREPATILLIDDDRVPSQYYARALTLSGFNVQYADNVDEAFDVIETSEPRLILLDLMMPAGQRYASEEHQDGMRTGVFLLRDIRRKSRELPVAILTMVTESTEIEELRKADPNLYLLPKVDYPPFAMAEWVREFLSKGEED